MTLTAALCAALATPSDLEPLRKMSAREGADVAEAYRNLTAAMIGFALRDADYLVEHVPIILDVLNGAGAPLPDLAAIMREAGAAPEVPRSAEWVSAAERLAAWADGGGDVMPPTTSDRFFALAARVESALPAAGYTAEDAAELVGALRSYWVTPTEQALEALKGTQERVLFAAARAGKVNRDHPALPAHYALDRAAQAFFANDSEPFTGRDSTYYLDRCAQCLEVKS